MLIHIIDIASALTAGWILSWFGFDDLVIKGAKEIFGMTISTTGYYFLFAILGALRSIRSNVFKPIEWKNKK